MIGTLLFFGGIIGVIILCICCLTPSCPCYYRRSHTTRTVVVAQPQPTPQVVAMTATTANTTAYPEQPPPAYNPDHGYVHQPYPPAPPPVGYPDYPTGYPNYPTEYPPNY